jgi:hypothetical protein
MDSFKGFVRKFMPPLWDGQVEVIVAEHERMVKEAVDKAVEGAAANKTATK